MWGLWPKAANTTAIHHKDTREEQGLSRPVSPGRSDGKGCPGGYWRHLKNKADIRHSLQALMKGKSCLGDLVSFHDKVTYLVDEGKAVDAVSLDFSEAFVVVPYDILNRLSNCVTNGSVLHWVMNWLCGKALRAISNGAASACGWSLALSPGPSFRVSLVQTVLSVAWVLEWSASSAELLTALNWEVLWTPWRDKKPRRGCG